MATLRRIQEVQPGNDVPVGTISSMISTLNALVDAAQNGGGGGGGASVAAAMAASGGGVGGASPVLTPARLFDVVKDVSVGPVGQRDPINGAYWPSQVKYVIDGMGAVTMPDTPLVPFYGRPVKGDEARIYPAAKGAICFIERYPDPARGNKITVRLYLLPGNPGGEVVARRRCGG